MELLNELGWKEFLKLIRSNPCLIFYLLLINIISPFILFIISIILFISHFIIIIIITLLITPFILFITDFFRNI